MGEILQKANHVPEALVELVVDATDGNPFYIEELVKWMLEAGVIEKHFDRWTVHEQKVDRSGPRHPARRPSGPARHAGTRRAPGPAAGCRDRQGLLGRGR